MPKHHLAAAQLLALARTSACSGHRTTACEIFRLAEYEIEREPDPIRYLALTLQADLLVRDHFLPRSGL